MIQVTLMQLKCATLVQAIKDPLECSLKDIFEEGIGLQKAQVCTIIQVEEECDIFKRWDEIKRSQSKEQAL